MTVVWEKWITHISSAQYSWNNVIPVDFTNQIARVPANTGRYSATEGIVVFTNHSQFFFLGNTAAETEAASGPNEEKPLPPAPVSSPVAPAPVSSPIAPAPAPAPTRSRRNPPGGKSSLVLG